jgi:NAD(P)-dependent dehydrogenase (short-subunit alcohol dehydrogenase family)
MKIQGMKRQCFITGAASGIGKSTALALAPTGTRLFLTDIDMARLKETVDMAIAAGGAVSSWKALDVSDFTAVKQFADEIHGAFGPMDIVMNIAGIAVWGAVEDLRHEEWERVIRINLMGPIHVMECFLPPMIRARRGGHLVNVSSAAGLIALPLHAPYSATKFGLRGISEVLRYDLKKHGIDVTVICPGAVDTPLKEAVHIAGVNKDHPEIRRLIKRFAEHAVKPEKVASMIIKGITRRRFLVITSMDIWAAYWLKRKLFTIYHFIMNIMNSMISKIINSPGIKLNRMDGYDN